MPQMHEAPPPIDEIYRAQGPRGVSPTGIRRERGRSIQSREGRLASVTSVNDPRASATRENGIASIMDPNTIIEPITAPKSDKNSKNGRVSSSGLMRRSDNGRITHTRLC